MDGSEKSNKKNSKNNNICIRLIACCPTHDMMYRRFARMLFSLFIYPNNIPHIQANDGATGYRLKWLLPLHTSPLSVQTLLPSAFQSHPNVYTCTGNHLSSVVVMSTDCEDPVHASLCAMRIYMNKIFAIDSRPFFHLSIRWMGAHRATTACHQNIILFMPQWMQNASDNMLYRWLWHGPVRECVCVCAYDGSRIDREAKMDIAMVLF